MTRYLISFDDGGMTFLDEDLADVAKAAHEMVEQAKDAGGWVFGGGVKGHSCEEVPKPLVGTKLELGGRPLRPARGISRGGGVDDE